MRTKAPQPSLHRPYHSAEIVDPSQARRVSGAGEARLCKRRKPGFARDETADVPPAPKETEERIKSPGRATIVGIRSAFAQDQDAAITQHVEQMAERHQLVSGAVQRIDRENRVDVSPSARLVEIVALDRSCDLLSLEQEGLQIGANKSLGDVAGNQGAAAS